MPLKMPLKRREVEPVRGVPAPIARPSTPPGKRQYEWEPDWPSYDEAMVAATQEGSQRDACISIVTMLYRTKPRPESPHEFLSELYGLGMSEYAVMTFLFEAGLARYRRS